MRVSALLAMAGVAGAAALASAGAPGDAAAASAAEGVELRGRREGLRGEVLEISARGVLVRLEAGGSGEGAGGVEGAQRLVSWDVIRRVTGAREGEFARLAPVADSVWRARSRVDRGDFARAEELVEPLYESARGTPGLMGGPTGAVLAECAVRVRLARGWSTGAAWAWLDWTAARTRGAEVVWVGGTAAGPVVLDGATGLSPWLPPVFSPRMGARAVRAFVESPEWARLERAGGATAALARLYRAAAAAEVGLSEGKASEWTGEAAAAGASGNGANAGGDVGGAGVALVMEMVTARVGDMKQREAARGALTRRLEGLARGPRAAEEGGESGGAGAGAGAAGGTESGGSGGGVTAGAGAAGNVDAAGFAPAWQEAWCRLGLGRSLLREPEAALRRRGLVHLLHVPARFGDALPTLAALALDEAAVELERMGDAAGAASLRNELAGRFGPWAPGEASAGLEPADGAGVGGPEERRSGP